MNKKLILKSLLLPLAFVCVFSVRLSMLKKTNEANGLDGYFYALQARSFVETGHLENPSHEPGYYLCGISSFFMKDSILGVKVWSALSSSLTCLSAFLLLYALTVSFSLSFLGFFLIASSPSFSSMSINYINNQTGICFLLFYVYFLVLSWKLHSQKLPLKKQIPSITLCIIFFILSVISHKVTMIFSFAITFVIFLPYFLQIGKEILKKRRRAFRYFTIILILGVALVFIILALLFFNRHAPRFARAFSLPSFKNHNLLDRTVTKFGTLEIAFYAFILYLLSAIALFKKSTARNLLLLVPLLYFPFWNLESDMGVRILMSAIPLGIPLFLYELNLLLPENFLSKIRKIICSLLSLLLLAGLFFTPRVYNPKNDPPYAYYRKVVSKIQLPADNLLIAHLGINHVYTYYNGFKDALSWLPDFEIEPEKTWRLAYGLNYSYLLKFFEERSGMEGLPSNYGDLIEHLDSKYTLLREDLWNFYLSNEDYEIAQSYKNWYNPHEVRPAYIRKVKKVRL